MAHEEEGRGLVEKEDMGFPRRSRKRKKKKKRKKKQKRGLADLMGY